jgi:transposase
LGRSRGGFSTKIHLVSDAEGHGLHLTLSAGQGSDLTHAIPTLEGVIVRRKRGRPRRRPRVAIVADRAYTFRPVRQWARRHGLRSYLPRRKDQRPRGRPPCFDREAYRRRPAIERLIGRLKEWRAVGTRYDKLAVNYLATVQVALIADYLRQLERFDSSDRA